MYAKLDLLCFKGNQCLNEEVFYLLANFICSVYESALEDPTEKLKESLHNLATKFVLKYEILIQ